MTFTRITLPLPLLEPGGDLFGDLHGEYLVCSLQVKPTKMWGIFLSLKPQGFFIVVHIQPPATYQNCPLRVLLVYVSSSHVNLLYVNNSDSRFTFSRFWGDGFALQPHFSDGSEILSLFSYFL